MAEFHNSQISSMEEIFQQAHGVYRGEDPEIVLRYTRMHRKSEMDKAIGSHHIYGEYFFPPAIYSGQILHDFALIRKDNQEQDLWSIFEKHGRRAFRKGVSSVCDFEDPYRRIRSIDPQNIGLNLQYAWDRSMHSSATLQAPADVLDPKVIARVEDRAREKITNPVWRLFANDL